MTPELGKLPKWALRERQRDLAWLRENFHIFWPAATAAFMEHGRGAIVVDTTSQPVKGRGNPFGYFPQAVIDTGDDEDIKRMVREYNPDQEFVVMLIKTEGRTSIYRVGQKQPQGSTGQFSVS